MLNFGIVQDQQKQFPNQFFSILASPCVLKVPKVRSNGGLNGIAERRSIVFASWSGSLDLLQRNLKLRAFDDHPMKRGRQPLAVDSAPKRLLEIKAKTDKKVVKPEE